MFNEEVLDRLENDLKNATPINESLPNGGVLHFDKIVPYICIYRYTEYDHYFSGLLKTQAAYLIVHSTIDIYPLVERLADTISTKLNAFLIIEMWPLSLNNTSIFSLKCPDKTSPTTIGAFEDGIQEMKSLYPEVSLNISRTNKRHPTHLKALLDIKKSKNNSTLILGLGVPTIYHRPEENQIFSLFYRKFTTKLSEILKRVAFEFIRVQTSNPYNHYLMLGKTNIDKLTLDADKMLANISEGLSFLLRTTPVNSFKEWEQFKKNKFLKAPSFAYRLISIDPEREKRALYDIPLEDVDDPTIAYILRDKRLEIEKQLTMLEERGTDNFRYTSESLYGTIDPKVIDGAIEILNAYPHPEVPTDIDTLDCKTFASKAQEEIDYLKQLFPELDVKFEIRDDVAGIMVSETTLLISDTLSVDIERCDALIQHEVATHILTYCNGKKQPFKQMYAGFAGYDQLQEGLAVLAEVLVGGLKINRLRLLAGRVMAANSLVSGASFIETFNLLHKKYNFIDKTAYYISMRVYRGGGLTKDAVYLAGLMEVLEYIKEGGELGILYAGKFSMNHIELIDELMRRQVLKEPKLPRFLNRPDVQKNLEILRKGIPLNKLIKLQL
ncbi:flavohemoglobin expression-modulating QEGLA motif protein [Dokdonia sp. Hel_I_53]|uniref:flavohemoglobin expression-modulating QEGLA motif protein n=1 Tax=Dokdonia sp. Hel_I_53 TaxID=1566287 RepID=UPI00119A63FF|nr:tyrosine/phenylalanine carboxypeptidase domain-containing protein [Dokdonia sp. Hel_I_53]TVZ51316.1 uncharacterized protein (TIGR02421 family) [Dokdonia sp. Hel_I_53]